MSERPFVIRAGQGQAGPSTPGMERLTLLERPDAWQGYIDRRLGREVEVVTKNWSTSQALPELSEGTRARLTEHYRAEYDIWQHLLDHEGEWAPPAGYVPGR